MEKEIKKVYIVYTEEDKDYYILLNSETKFEFKMSKKVWSLEKLLAHYGQEIISFETKR